MDACEINEVIVPCTDKYCHYVVSLVYHQSQVVMPELGRDLHTVICDLIQNCTPDNNIPKVINMNMQIPNPTPVWVGMYSATGPNAIAIAPYRYVCVIYHDDPSTAGIKLMQAWAEVPVDDNYEI